MVGLESFQIRKDELIKRRQPLMAEWEHFLATAEETPENGERAAQLMTAIHVMDGRLLELDAWIEMLTRFPGVTRPDQLPTKGNTPAHVPLTLGKTPAQVTREREGKFQHDAAQLVSVLPDTGDGGR
jgi:hypothetical protein